MERSGARFWDDHKAANQFTSGAGGGPYRWAPDCASGVTNRGGVCYDRADFVADGVHPSAAGGPKIAGLIDAPLLREAWYRR